MGWSYEVETVFVAAYCKTPGRHLPVQELCNVFLEVKSDDGGGAVSADVIGRKNSPGFLTGPQERAGARVESVVTLHLPKGYATAYVREFARRFPDVVWTLLPAYREPATVQVAVRKPSTRKRFPYLG